MNSESDQYLWALIQDRASRGDKDAINVLGSLYVDRAVKENNIQLLELAEKNFTLAAKFGNDKAASFLESRWVKVKAECVEKIRLRLDGGSGEK